MADLINHIICEPISNDFMRCRVEGIHDGKDFFERIEHDIFSVGGDLKITSPHDDEITVIHPLVQDGTKLFLKKRTGHPKGYDLLVSSKDTFFDMNVKDAEEIMIKPEGAF